MAMAAAASLLCSTAILPNSADADERSEWLVILVFVGVFCAALAVRSFYTSSKRKEDLFSFIFKAGGKHGRQWESKINRKKIEEK
jgi:hypothetical protein